MENKTPRYINTNELIYIYNRWIEQLQSPEDAGALEGVQSCLDVLLEQPIVDAVPLVHGRWHDVYLMTPWIATGICSHCNLKSYINPDFPFAKYCPNCGAKMDLEK